MMLVLPLRRLACLILISLYIVETQGATKCYKNDALGEAEGNVYNCYDDEKPECCEEASQFTCCETSTSRNLREQLQLWGTVAAFILVLGVLFLCCKNDYSLCNDDKPLMQRLGLRRKRDPPLTDINQARSDHQTTSLDRNLHSHTINKPYLDDLPPLPPVTPYQEKGSGGGRGGMYPSLDTPPSYRGRHNNGFVDDDEEEYLCK